MLLKLTDENYFGGYWKNGVKFKQEKCGIVTEDFILPG